MIKLGLELLNNSYEIIRIGEYLESYKLYRTENITTNNNNSLLSEDDINFYLARQEKYKEGINKRKEYEALEKIREDEEVKRLEFLNYDLGFTKNKSDIQRGKILKCLNKDILYYGDLITRKELIFKLINKDSYTREILLTNRHSDKKINLTYRKLKDKTEYRFYFSSSFIEITKTEMDFINYLIDNNKIEECKKLI